ncbi:Rieske 2Fe-2S domain-containing protein [Burkholderia gladioli]|uniref:Rieske 2Fe-2S domain-containing protein n=2 Tax=Burkholderia gladioli TaxID=28095 RepID=UPI000CDA8941|nr:Rieske 2Fe-2S domain-containing protein [Burkholderia gladioli]KAF1058394.1 Phthalate 4,5-dioxygenase oxygenase subunit [Burkholderia gladioli]MBJ9675685.1 Rieske 2Fe-2S domain-containing protein [Burkholderia gladioli]MDN7461341.1 Rieske 2Fe-2S domain-containing protein [Burkholderia gladioli]MDN7495713.1 Rieske 2Fe-2S domain-containing protein [Burkholderia gladioli]MDN7598730.1 Rieske 2Fe-2S domain-containing protein [Burkholderia gladioli]
MLAASDNDLLTQVGPDTPMGKLMRQFWVPVCLSSELVRDGEPLRIMLLGERLIAFRDTDGKVGVMDHRCPHRCASMYFGRNEQGGVRCVYHGWKFDTEGNCVDMPNVPPEQDFKNRVKARAYKVLERTGLVWAYMGPREQPPAFPNMDCLQIPEAERSVFVHQRDCNWLQSAEGDIDTSHFGFLHIGGLEVDDVDPESMHKWGIAGRAPEYSVKETPWGTMYAAYRAADPGELYYRFAHFLFPFFTFTPNGSFNDLIACTINVPMDDQHTMSYRIAWDKRTMPLQTMKTGEPIPGLAPDSEFLPRTNDWFGRWRLAANRDNDYFIDREQQRTVSFTGIQGIGRQDQAVIESMGAVVDRSFEHLAASDRMIMVTRRRLIQAARALVEQGRAPEAVDDPDVYLGARGGSFLASDQLDWQQAYQQNLELAVRKVGEPERALDAG